MGINNKNIIAISIREVSPLHLALEKIQLYRLTSISKDSSIIILLFSFVSTLIFFSSWLTPLIC